jgi:hypothetical protein
MTRIRTTHSMSRMLTAGLILVTAALATVVTGEASARSANGSLAGPQGPVVSQAPDAQRHEQH